MGTSASAQCSACGYSTFLQLGGGRRNFRQYAAWPVHCRKCKEIETANFLQSPLICKTCGSSDVTPVSDPILWMGDGDRHISWQDLVLTTGHYRCPKCDGFSLRFSPGGMQWD